MIPIDAIDKLETIWRSVSSLGGELEERQWKLPTELAGWTVQDNLAHLIGTERMLQALPAAEMPQSVGDHVKNPIGHFNEAEVEARRAQSGAGVLAEWNELVEVRVSTLRGANDDYFAKQMATPTGPGTMADFLDIRVLDCWIHEQDMRRAVGKPGHRGGPAAEHTVDRLLRTIPIVVGKRAATPEGGAVIIDITGGVERRVVCEVNGGRAAIVEHAAHEPLATIVVDSETFVILATGRRPARLISERIATSGDEILAQRILDNLNMMI